MIHPTNLAMKNLCLFILLHDILEIFPSQATKHKTTRIDINNLNLIPEDIRWYIEFQNDYGYSARTTAR